jgi:hypothetical protein
VRNSRKSPIVVLDTNVLYAADDRKDAECQRACIQQIKAITEGHQRLAVDTTRFILKEYCKDYESLSDQSYRRQFSIWIFRHLYTDCLRVNPQPIDDSGTNFKLFPSDPNLAGFHLDDRKFVAVAIAAQQKTGREVPILNAIDSDWCNYLAELQRNGVKVRFLCPHRMPSDECR